VTGRTYPRGHQLFCLQRLGTNVNTEAAAMFNTFPGCDATSSDRSSCSPTSVGSSPASSSRGFGGTAKVRMQDKQIEKGKAIMMRDYVSHTALGAGHVVAC
jgi:hypothetical protein